VIECVVVTYIVELVKEHGIYVKFSFKGGKMAAETLDMLHEACGSDASSQVMTRNWFKCFEIGITSTKDEKQCGWPSRSDTLIAQVENIINGNCGITVNEVAGDIEILNDLCHTIFLQDLEMQ
jgi:hypothetical protein